MDCLPFIGRKFVGEDELVHRIARQVILQIATDELLKILLSVSAGIYSIETQTTSSDYHICPRNS